MKEITTQFHNIAECKLQTLLNEGWEINGVSIRRTHENGTVERGAVTDGGMVLWWHNPQRVKPQSQTMSNPSHVEAQVAVPLDYPIEGVVGTLADVLADGVYQSLRDNSDSLIKRETNDETGSITYTSKVLFVSQKVLLSQKEKEEILAHKHEHPPVHPEDAWIESERDLNCPLCNGSGHVDDARRCKRCNTPMQPGIAMAQTYRGKPDFPSDADDPNAIVTRSPGGLGKLINCLKCPQCGWSVTA